MLLIPALRRQEQEDLHESKASLVNMNKFQDSHGSFTEKSCLEKLKPKQNKGQGGNELSVALL